MFCAHFAAERHFLHTSPWDEVILEPSDIEAEPLPGTTLIIVGAFSG